MNITAVTFCLLVVSVVVSSAYAWARRKWYEAGSIGSGRFRAIITLPEPQQESQPKMDMGLGFAPMPSAEPTLAPGGTITAMPSAECGCGAPSCGPNGSIAREVKPAAGPDCGCGGPYCGPKARG